MKRLVLGLLALMLMVGLSGCGGIEYNINKNRIKNNQYSWESKNIRVIGVFKNTNENKNKIEKAVNDVLISFENINTLKCKTKHVYKYENDYQLRKECNYKLYIGYYGSYRNAYEKQKLFDICKRELGDKKIYKRYCQGRKIKTNINKKNIQFTETNNGKSYSTTAYIKIKSIDNYLTVYIKNKPYTGYIANDFIKLNNKLISEFKKLGLKNIKLNTITLKFK